MIIVKSLITLQKIIKTIDKTIGFVPTMGALHQGHISLINRSKKENMITIVSIFINPTQFLENEDLDKYPKKESSDQKICKLINVDYLFMPDINTMYNTDEILIKAPKIKGFIIEGEKRAGHFDGMLQIVLKLLCLVKPTNSYFGKKDAQQLYLIEQLKENFYLDTNIIACEIIREDDGLAMSSRNIYLNKEQRIEASCISSALNEALKLIIKSKLDTKDIIDAINSYLSKSQLIQIEYIYIVDRKFNLLSKVDVKNSIILIAAKIGNTRLIDNIWV